MLRVRNCALLCGAAVAALSWADVGAAQQSPQTGAAAQNDQIETVVVTASRRSEAVQNVAGEVSALTSADLEQMHAKNFMDFASFVPGLSYASGGPTENIVAIRGVTTGNTQLGSAIGLYLDDVPLGASTQFGLGFQSFNINAFDLNRVEVLNGPQGTLYGANALGGAIRYITEKPDLDAFQAKGEAEVSDTAHGSVNDGLRAMINIPLLDGKAALRVDGTDEYDSGFTASPGLGQTNVGAARTLGGRVAFLWQINPDLDVKLSAFTQKIVANGADAAFFDPYSQRAVGGDYSQYFRFGQPAENALDLYSAVINYDFHWAKLTSVTGYQYNFGSYTSDVSTFYDGLFNFYDILAGGPYYDATHPYPLVVDDTTRKFTQEVRLASPDNTTFEWVVGGYLDREITHEGVLLEDGATSNGTIPTGYVGEGALPFFGFLPSTYSEMAVFADGTYYITDKLDLTLGMRYSSQHQEYQSYISYVLEQDPYAIAHYQAGSNQSVETYLINPRYHLTDDTMVYARVSSGFRPGGPNFVIPGDKLPPTFQPDKLWNYELGEKSQLLDQRATFDFDIYDIEWASIQATQNVSGINQLVNAGNARIQGAESTFAYRVTPALTVNGTAAYTDAQLTTTSGPLGVGYKGAQLPLAPRYNFAVAATYAFDFGGGYSGSVNASDVWVGSRTSGYLDGTLPQYKLPSYNTVNLNLALFLPRNMEIDAYLKNIFDSEGQVSGSTLANSLKSLATFIPSYGAYADAPVPVNITQPRTVGLVLKVALDQ